MWWLKRSFQVVNRRCSRFVSYIQGQAPSPKIREYFYYVDHNGQLFLDDARMKNFTSCFKEKQFLQFFFSRLKVNDTDRYPEFPYLSLCGRERNFIRCDDRPIVFTQVIASSDMHPDLFSYCKGGELLTVKFQPQLICMLPQSGRIYHPAPERAGGVGLISSELAIEFSKNFEFAPEQEYEPPTTFKWKGERYSLTNELLKLLTEELKEESL